MLQLADNGEAIHATVSVPPRVVSIDQQLVLAVRGGASIRVTASVAIGERTAITDAQGVAAKSARIADAIMRTPGSGGFPDPSDFRVPLGFEAIEVAAKLCLPFGALGRIGDSGNC